MYKSLVVLAIAGTMSAGATAQATQGSPAANEAQQAKPQTVKKRICEENDNPYSHINRVCRTVEVPVTQSDSKAADKQVSSKQQPQNPGY
jgi:hypothetical protein